MWKLSPDILAMCSQLTFVSEVTLSYQVLNPFLVVSIPKATLFYSSTIASFIVKHLRNLVPSTATSIGHLIDEFDFAAIPEEVNLLFQVYLLESFIDPLYDIATKFISSIPLI